MNILVKTRFREGTGEWELRVRLLHEEASQKKEVRTLAVEDSLGQVLAQGLLAPAKEPEEEREAVLSVRKAMAWSPEHPVCYRLRISGEEFGRNIGFCQIRKEKKRVFFNGEPVKLRGICYQEEPGTKEAVLRRDLELLKAANVNYLRSVGGPFGPLFLSLCDELGFWVENTAPLSGVGDTKEATQNSPAHLEAQYLGPFRKMVEEEGYHPCILLWSLGEDCVWGSNFREMYRYVKAVDPDRLVNFHLPMTIPDEDEPMDVWSVHYIDWRQPMDEHYDQMVIFHSPGAHNEIGYATGQAQDLEMPVLHDIYAPIAYQNLEQIERDPGIREFWGESLKRHWEKMEKTEGCLGGAVLAAVDGKFSWGVLDAAHQPKPEYHHLKMVYAPKLPFWKTERFGSVEVSNGRFTYRFSTETCLLTEGLAGETPVLAGGPYLQATGLKLEDWIGTGMEVLVREAEAEVRLRGSYGKTCDVEFTLTLYPDGTIRTAYEILKLNVWMPHTVKAGIGLDPGGVQEKGIAYRTAAGMETLSWERDGLWDWYPAGHIGGNTGSCSKNEPESFRSMKHRIRRAMVSNPETGAWVLVKSDGTHSLRLEEAPQPEMIVDDRDGRISYEGNWYRAEDVSGEWKDTETMSRQKGDSCTFSFEGTGIEVYGPTDVICGDCDIFLDGKKEAERVSQYPKEAEFPIMSRGYEKRHRVCLFRKSGLENGAHTLRIEVLGEGPREGYVSLDYLVVEAPEFPAAERLIVNTDYNYTRLVQGNYQREKVSLKAGVLEECLLCIGKEADV
ncbi:MAG: glycoside hydrolase family 2 TIM barrel-domain containing protein [Eubacteriales bacterium]|nr:glycoside hydrolase family 2 TIM barrel-domain containing protein [Eubacteriales bacterium]